MMRRGKKFFLREALKKFIKDKDYGFLGFLLDVYKLLRFGVDLDDSNGQKLFFKTEGGLTMALYNNREIHSHILNGGFEQHITNILSGLVKPGDVCLDVGANIGFYSIFMADKVGPTGKVFSFEPVEYNRKKLQLNKSLNGLRNITLIEKALGDKSEALKLKVYPEESNLIGHHSFVENETIQSDTSYTEELVEVMSVDEWLIENEINKVDLVKVDIEGFEYSFFRGARELLKMSPIIIFEHSSERIKELGIKESEFGNILNEYVCYQILSDGLLEYNFEGEMHPFASDIIAIPKSMQC